MRTLAQLARACDGRLSGEDRSFAEVVIDTRKLSSGDVFAALRGQRVDGHQFVAEAARKGAAGVLVEHEVSAPVPQIRVPSVEAALAEAGKRARAEFQGVLIGVAGSNGKTTVKEMITAILSLRGPCLATRGNLNNQLGVPLTLLRLAATHWSAVIEMGANRAGDVAQLAQWARPSIGLITNAGAEHLEGFGSLEGVARAEGEMVAGLPPQATAIINADDPYASLWQTSTAAKVLCFGLSRAAEFRAERLRLSMDEHGFASRFWLHSPAGRSEIALSLAGRHNVVNALAAAAAASAAGATLAEIAAGLAGVRAVPGRLQLRRGRNRCWLIDDSYNANPSSLRVALEVLQELPGRHWLLLGEMAELGAFTETSHRDAGALARSLGVERLYALGPLAALAADSFGAGGARFDELAPLLRTLEAELQPDVTLLIKGSRVARLERVSEALAAERPAGAGGGAAAAQQAARQQVL
jgi:UDP-N-acetylmuramoyl-tripeptide--D-alanyl-D-alanine ligase